MSIWLLPALASVGLGVGFGAYRAWSQEAALMSGELMDMRDCLPEGGADMTVRVLADRRYRVELQFEAILASAEEQDALPLRLEITPAASDRPMGVAEANESLPIAPPLYQRERSLQSLLRLGASQRREGARPPAAGEQIRCFGSVPLLEFSTAELTRLHFDLELPLVDERSGERVAWIEKASLVVKEDVGRLRAPKSLLDRVSLTPPG